jgi:dihydroneopterin aldolase
MQTTIFVEGLLIEASIGVHPHEHESRQPVIMDIWVDLNGIAPEDDRLHETFDYAEVASHAERLAMEAHVQLVETLASRIITWALGADLRVDGVKVRIRKPQALLKADAAGVVMEARRDNV